MYQANPPLPPNQTLPTMWDLPTEDPEEPGVPDEFHIFQPQLLRETCQPPTYSIEEIFIGTDLNLYYDARHPLWYKRPDWFLVLGVSRAQQQADLRLSYVIWQEGVAPYLAIELLSPGTEAEDLGQTLRDVNQPPSKWQTYEQVLRIPYYVVFDRYQNQLQVFRLVATRYEAISLPEQRFWFAELKLGLAVWQGRYQGIEGQWLRWYDSQSNWILNADESKEREWQRAERLAERLRQLGVNSDEI